MDSSAHAGPSAPRKPRHKASKAAAKADAAATGSMDVDAVGGPSTGNGTAHLQASSSKLPSMGTEGRRHKERHHKKKVDAAGDATPAEAVPAKALTQSGDARPHAEGEGKKHRSRKRRGQHGGQAQKEQEGGAVWECHPLAQGNVSSIPPVWSPDGRFYMTVDSRSILIHSPAPPYTLLSTLSSTHPKGHSKPITAMLISPVSPNNHLVTAGEDGRIMVWDYVKGDLVYSIEATNEGKVGHLSVAKIGEEWVVFGTTSVLKKGKGRTPAEYQYQQRVIRLSYPTRTNPSPTKHIIGRLSSAPTALFVAPSSLYLIALAGNKAYTYLLPSSFPPSAPSSSVGPSAAAGVEDKSLMPQCVKFVSDHSLTCGAFAPADKLAMHGGSGKGKGSEDWFATGDERGVIRLWHGLGRAFALLNNANPGSGSGGGASSDQVQGAERRLPTTSLHWHAHAVAALAFTPGGSQLLSVGEESVLVQWHLASGKREYIPRLGGRPIVSLAVKEGKRGQEEEWYVALKDGSRMKVGAASGNISPVGQGVRLDPLTSISPSAPYPLSLHPPTSSLVLPSSHPSTVQFVDPARSTVLFDLEVAPSNRVNRRDVKELEGVAVEHVAFSDAVEGRSEWMASVEGREGDEWEGSGAVRVLKVWRWDVGAGRYMVNTTQPRPHGLTHITALAFSHVEKEGERPLLLTADKLGGVKTWTVRQSKKSEQGKTSTKKAPTYELYWTQRSSWSYRSFPVHSAAFSRDGTIVALAHGPVVSLWDTDSNTLLKTLDADSLDITELLFVGDEGRYLIGAGKGLISWDLFSCEAIWTIDIPHAHLSAHPSGFTALSTVSDLSILSLFSASSSKPISEYRINAQSFRSVLRIPSHSHASATSGKSGLSFVGVTTRGEVVKFGEASTPAPRLTASLAGKQYGAESDGKRGIWQEMFGDRAFALHNADVSASGDARGQGRVGKVERKIQGRASAVFDGPSHTLPPISMLFDAFIDEVLALPVVGQRETAQGRTVGAAKNGTIDLDFTDEGESERAGAGDLSGGSTGFMPTHGRKKDEDVDMREMESFFRQILLSPKSAPAQGKGKGKGKDKEKTKVRVAEAQAEQGDHAEAPVKMNRKERRQARPSMQAENGTGAAAISGAAVGDVDEDAAREVDAGAGGAVKVKAKKRKAPLESAGAP